jgi:hypothetical protein
MEVGRAPVCVVVSGRLAPRGAQQLADWQLIPHGNAGDRDAGNRRPR